MTKFDKVLQGLRCCKSGARDSVHDGALRQCHKCPYAGDYPCTSNLAADTLELINQERLEAYTEQAKEETEE